MLADTFTPALLTVGEWLQRSVLLRVAIPPVRLAGYERVERALVWLHERLHGPGVSGDYGAIERLRATGPRMTTDEFVKVIRAVATFHETTVDLPSIAVPVLVLYGEHEPAFVRRQARQPGTEIPDVSVRRVPDAGHASSLDNPAFFTAAVREFLAGIGPRDGADGPGDGDAGPSGRGS